MAERIDGIEPDVIERDAVELMIDDPPGQRLRTLKF
jgi:hypothetical protein